MTHPFRIIFVEGVPFTGKSTTSEYIAAQLRLNGHPAHWISEGMLFQRHFPQTLAMADQEKPFSTQVWQAEWAAFVEQALAAPEIWVVDSVISYVGILPLMNEDWPRSALDAELRQIVALCAPLQPRIIHMIGDVDRLVPDSIVDRGEAWREQLIRQSDMTPYQRARGRSGLEGATILMRESQDLSAEVLASAGWPMLTLDVSPPDWAGRQRAILGFLGLTEVLVERPDLPRDMLESATGTYAPVDPARDARTLSVKLEDETLILYGPDDQRYGPLVPLSPTRFHLRATPIDIEFLSEDGRTQQLTLFRSDGSAEVYRRA
jgi:hypothetical protein